MDEDFYVLNCPGVKIELCDHSKCETPLVNKCHRIATCNIDTTAKEKYMNVDGDCVENCPKPLVPDAKMLKDTNKDTRCHRECTSE